MYVAKDSGSIVVGAETYNFRRGITRFEEGHPAVLAAPDLFEPITPHYRVEQATAAPGELRGS